MQGRIGHGTERASGEGPRSVPEAVAAQFPRRWSRLAAAVVSGIAEMLQFLSEWLACRFNRLSASRPAAGIAVMRAPGRLAGGQRRT
jgi:hypothetical protein